MVELAGSVNECQHKFNVRFHLKEITVYQRLTKFGTSGTVDVEGIIATALGATDISENETIGAEFLRQLKVTTLVVAIALNRISENTILLRTITTLAVNYSDVSKSKSFNRNNFNLK